MKQTIIHNLSTTGACLSTLCVFYIANICFSLWQNVSFDGQKFDPKRLFKSALKLLVFLFGLTLLSIGISAMPTVISYAGLNMGAELEKIATQASITAIIMTVSLKYLKESVLTFNAILNKRFKTEEE